MTRQWGNLVLALGLILTLACRKGGDQEISLQNAEAGTGAVVTRIAPQATLSLRVTGPKAAPWGTALEQCLARIEGLELIRGEGDQNSPTLTLNGDGDSLRVKLTGTGGPDRVWTLLRESAAVWTDAASLARGVSTALGLAFTPPVPFDGEAQSLWLQAQIARMQASGDGARDTTIALLKAALKADETFTPAWTGLAETYLECFDAQHHVVWLTLAQEAALRVEPANPASGQALLGQVLVRRGDWRQANQAFVTALEANPFSLRARSGRGRLLLSAGLYLPAVEELEQAVRLAPQRADLWLALGWAHLGQGSHTQALACFEKADPANVRAVAGRALALGRAKRWNEARALLDNAEPSPLLMAIKALVMVEDGEKAEALKMLDCDLAPIAEADGGLALAVAGAYARLGRPGEALRWLDKAATAGYADYAWILSDPMLKSLRQDKRSAPALERIAARWREQAGQFQVQ